MQATYVVWDCENSQIQLFTRLFFLSLVNYLGSTPPEVFTWSLFSLAEPRVRLVMDYRAACKQSQKLHLTLKESGTWLCVLVDLHVKQGWDGNEGEQPYSKGKHDCRLTFQTALALLNSRRPHKSQRKACMEDLSEVLRRLKVGGLSLHVTGVELAWQHKPLQQSNMLRCTLYKHANVQTFPQELFVWMQVCLSSELVVLNTKAKCIQIHL